MTKCTVCDAALADDAVYCPKCGMKANRAGGVGPSPEAGENADASGGSGGGRGFGGGDVGGGDVGGGDVGGGDNPSDRLRALQADGASRGDTAEEELWQGTYSPKAMAATLILGVVLSIAVCAVVYKWIGDGMGTKLAWSFGLMAAIWLVIGARLLYRRWSVRYRLTNQRFFHEKGILSRVTDRIEVIDMDDITFVQGILDRMLGVGTIKVTSSDRTHPELVLVGIDDVKEVAAKIDAARRAERVRRGLHIEQI